MTQRFACLVLGCLGLAAASHSSVISATDRPVADIEILVNGNPVRRYAHDGRLYVEALKDKAYAIRIHNPYPVRVAVALSVDGLNTIDARQTTAAAARKWVLAPYESATISGWQTSQSQARRFEFTTEERSYGAALGKTNNLGVISAVFFKERTPAAIASGRQAPSTEAPAASAANERAAAQSQRRAREDKATAEYAATGMGERVNHGVTQVWMDLEGTPAHTVDIRYEFRTQLVRLGVIRSAAAADPLQRRERAQGFEPGFCPEPPPHR